MTSKIVKLCFQQHQSTETLVDSFPARDWGAFVLVRLTAPGSDEEIARLQDTLQPILQELYPDKEVIVVPDNINLAIYGVEVRDEGED